MLANYSKEDPPELYLKVGSLDLKFHWTFDVDIHSIDC